MKKKMTVEDRFHKDVLSLKRIQEDGYAKALYASLCNVIWVNRYTNEEYSCTWRYSGRIVAEIRGKGEDYMHFYCSGNEGTIRQDIYDDFKKLGWKPKSYGCDGIKIVPVKVRTNK